QGASARARDGRADPCHSHRQRDRGQGACLFRWWHGRGQPARGCGCILRRLHPSELLARAGAGGIRGRARAHNAGGAAVDAAARDGDLRGQGRGRARGFAWPLLWRARRLLRGGLSGPRLFPARCAVPPGALVVALGTPLHRAIVRLRWSFRGRPGIVRLLWLLRIALALAAFGFVAGMGVGFLAGKTNAIPGAVVKPALSSLLSASGGATPVQEAIGIFGHNLLAFVLAALLAILTAGLSGFALTFLPGFLLGYSAVLSSGS